MFKYTFFGLFLLLISCSEKQTLNALDGFETKDVVTNLNTPWEILWGPDNYIWFTERYGRIGRANPETGDVHELIIIDEVYEDGERGLLGMVLHPNFDSNPYVYVVYNYLDGNNTIVKAVRYSYDGEALHSPFVVIDGIKGAWNHDGSRLWIDDDLKLYMTTGDAANSVLSQDTSNLNGNLLRMNLDGSIPDDNPFPNSYIYCFGLRNSQGLVFANGKIYSSDHGPATDDEVNILMPGRNYGWPNVKGYCETPEEIAFCEEHNVVEPIAVWTPTLAVAGLEYYNNDYIPEFKNSLIMATLKASRIVQLKLNDNGDEVIEEMQFYQGEFGRLRDICVSPDGRLFIATSNRDGRGNPKEADDRIIEIIPVNSSVIDNDRGTLNIFPNPSEETISIIINNDEFIGGVLKVFNYSGETMHNMSINNKNIDLSFDTPGVYYAVFQYENLFYNRKIVIAK